MPKNTMTFEPSSHSSFKNRKKIEMSNHCGCYYCLKQFYASDITEWWDEDDEGVGHTAVCPHCGIDSVIGDYTTEISNTLLKTMFKYWFW